MFMVRTTFHDQIMIRVKKVMKMILFTNIASVSLGIVLPKDRMDRASKGATFRYIIGPIGTEI